MATLDLDLMRNLIGGHFEGMNGYKKEHKNGNEVLKFEHGSRKITTRKQLNRKKKLRKKMIRKWRRTPPRTR